MIRFLRARFRRRYLGNYVHAKKLFVFDLALIASIVIITAFGIRWRLYQPKVILEQIRHIQKIIQPSAPAATVSAPPRRALATIAVEASVGGIRTVFPGGVVPITIHIKNISETALENATIAIPLPDDVIDMPRLYAMSRGAIKDRALFLTARERGELAFIPPHETIALAVVFPIADVPASTGTDLSLVFDPRVRGMQNGAIVEARAETAPVAMGTAIALKAELRYYTDEGDQLGRGPLPPEAGTQTKYAAIFTIQNTTSRVQNLTVSARLTEHAVWTGKTSVSHGRPVSYHSATKTFAWGIPALEPHDMATIYAEVGFTPETGGQTNAVALVQDIAVAGTDAFTNARILKQTATLDTSLPDDRYAAGSR